MRALQAHGPLSPQQLAPLVFCTLRHARRLLHLMHLKGLVYIVEWRKESPRHRGPYIRVYKLGIGVDAPSPPPIPVSERAAASRARKTVEEMDFERARRRQLRRKVKRDKLTAAFFGVKR
jgi:hypothetical protein